jgi:hypothetical protein
MTQGQPDRHDESIAPRNDGDIPAGTLAALRVEIAALRQEVRQLRDADAAVPPPNEGGRAASGALDRRGLLRGIGAAAAAGAGVVLLRADRADATAGNPLILGVANSADNLTTSLDRSGVGTQPTLVVTHDGTLTPPNATVTIGAQAFGVRSVAGIVAGEFHSLGAFGVEAAGVNASVAGPYPATDLVATATLARGDGIGGLFNGDKANLLLTPHVGSAPPAGDHATGEVFVTENGAIHVCTQGGNPASFVRLGLNPVVPTRMCDTRAGSGQPHAGETVRPDAELVLPVAGVPPVPAVGASAVLFNLCVASSTNGGYMTVYPDGVTRPLAASINFSAGQPPISNLVCCALGATGAIRLFTSTGPTEVVCDLVGYFS